MKISNSCNLRKFLLIHEVKEYPDMGGGIFYNTFDTENEVEEFIERLNNDERNLVILHLATIKDNLVIEPVEKITKFRIKHR